VDYTKIQNYEFDFGSEWTRAKSLDTCEFDWVSFFNLIVNWWVMCGKFTWKFTLTVNINL